jgi:phosphate transport system substrate-binding protein
MARRINLIASAVVGGWLAGMAIAPAQGANLTGAGSTFAYPIYAKWAAAYKGKTGIGLNYQSIGSGGGIKQITAGTVQFGATDMPLKGAALEKDGLAQFPTVMGGVVPVVNIPGIKPGELRLDGATLADIYLGKIRAWNDKAIATLNPGVKLPAKAIAVIHRADGSGTTFIFTDYLGKVSPEWKSKVGSNTAVQWPAGIGGKGNEGVAAYVKSAPDSIGYVEYAYALEGKLIYTRLKNKAGRFVQPTSAAFQAAAANADWASAPGFGVLLTDQSGAETWPISGATFVLMHKVQAQPDTARAVLTFFAWAYKDGDKMAESLDYVPLPDKLVTMIEASWAKDIKDQSGKPVWTAAH